MSPLQGGFSDRSWDASDASDASLGAPNPTNPPQPLVTPTLEGEFNMTEYDMICISSMYSDSYP